MNTKCIYSIRAAKNLDTDNILVYRAIQSSESNYEISVERYQGENLIEASSTQIQSNDVSFIDDLLKNLCLGSLEPCHLKDVIEDMNM